MSCQFQSPLTEDQLFQAASGSADPAVESHLAGCEWCRTHYEDIVMFQNKLETNLHPASKQLVDFRMGLLGDPIASAIQRHLVDCPSCQTELAQVDRLLNSESEPVQETVRSFPLEGLPQRVARRARDIIAQIIPPVPLGQRPAIGFLGTPTNAMVAEGTGVRILLSMESTHAGIVLSGQVMTTQEKEQSLWENAVLTLSRDDAEARSVTMLDDLGEFTCQPLPPGRARLRIQSLDGSAIYLNGLQLSDKLPGA